jgi:hypothetical protein
MFLDLQVSVMEEEQYVSLEEIEEYYSVANQTLISRVRKISLSFTIIMQSIKGLVSERTM